MSTRSKFILFAIILFISLTVAVVSSYFGTNFSATLSYIQSFAAVNRILSAVIYVAIFTALAAVSFSVSVIAGFGTLFFQVPELAAYSMIGMVAGAIIDFYISRKLGREYLRNYIERRGGKLENFDKVVEKDGFKTILILSAVFFVPPAIPNFLGGIINIDLKKYAAATFLGNLPNIFSIIYLTNGILYSNYIQIYVSIAGLVATTLIALFFYKGEIKDLLQISFPWLFKKDL